MSLNDVNVSVNASANTSTNVDMQTLSYTTTQQCPHHHTPQHKHKFVKQVA